jgi:hypothetical protein
MTHGVLLVFAKTPLPGAAKTRLHPALGAERAAELAAAFLRDTWQLALSVAELAAVLVLEGDPAAQPLLDADIWPQGDGDLGARLERALRRGIQEAGFAIAIGTDLPGLPADRISRAVELLASGAPSVLGPAADGGFYLLGLSRCPDGVLSGLPWSSERVYAETRARLTTLGLPPAQLDAWFDVDSPADLERLHRFLSLAPPSAAPHTRALLSRWAAP